MKKVRIVKFKKIPFEKGRFHSEEDILLYQLRRNKQILAKREAIKKLLR